MEYKMKKSDEDIIYHMELIENLLNGNIPTEKEDSVFEYLLWDDEWSGILHMEMVLREYGRIRREWN